VIATGGSEEERLCTIIETRVGGIEEDRSNGFSRRGAAGLTGTSHTVTSRLEVVGEGAGLGRLARPLTTLEDDEGRTGHAGEPTRG
jgi:hypothetical protein